MDDRTLVQIAQDAVALARRKGAQEAAAEASRLRDVEVRWRDGKLENLSEATKRTLGLELYVDGRYGAVSTSDLRPEAVERFVEDSIELTRALAPDPFRSLPEPALCAGQAAVDLQLEDPGVAGLEPARRRASAQAIEEAARAAKGAEAILSVTAGFSDGTAEVARVHSSGFAGTRRDTQAWMWAEVSVKDADGRRPEDWDAAGSRHLAALPDPGVVGRTAAERALGRLGARKGDSATLTMVVENRAAGRLVSFLLAPLGARALQQRQSFLEGKAGTKVGSDRLDFSDDPLLPRGLGSRLFDGEGLAARRFPVFEAGVLRNHYVDVYYGRKLKMAPTTRAASNLAWKLGPAGRDRLLAAVKDGILVTGFLGGNSNGTTGDFSLGVQGHRIREGRLAEPVAEMNVAGNHLEIWKRLAAVGDDPYAHSPLRTPTLVFEGVQFAGV
ncbi:MAG TPA: TldD/PmbA family protein [Anaeromyxobacteraceae bacterium]|nr:TldD/PmbA family protein [Anaeromyxobacteraceae bacterium]